MSKNDKSEETINLLEVPKINIHMLSYFLKQNDSKLLDICGSYKQIIEDGLKVIEFDYNIDSKFKEAVRLFEAARFTDAINIFEDIVLRLIKKLTIKDFISKHDKI